MERGLKFDRDLEQQPVKISEVVSRKDEERCKWADFSNEGKPMNRISESYNEDNCFGEMFFVPEQDIYGDLCYLVL